MKSTAKHDVIYLYVWSGDGKLARDLVDSRYPGIDITEFPHRRLREGSFKERIRLLRGFRGRAIVFSVKSLDDFKYRQVFNCIHFLHRCRETVLCDDGGSWETMRTSDVLRMVPGVFLHFLLDVKTLIVWWCRLHLRLLHAQPSKSSATSLPPASSGIAYLIPTAAAIGTSGGAISHVRGFLYGLRASGRTCRVFSGTPLAQDAFETEIVDPRNSPYLFWEAAMLAYNLVFARRVQKFLASNPPGAIYQRHCRFSIAGTLLSRRLKVPLILEYNGPEGWIAHHWDPTPFRSWISLCEEVSLRSAARIVVVSEALRAELAERGIPADRMRVNPNAVDSDFFSPGRGREPGRRELGVGPDEVLVGFCRVI